MPQAIVDTNVIIACLNTRDPNHRRCVALFERGEFDLTYPMLCLAEVSHLIHRDLDAETEARFLESLVDEPVDWPQPADWARMAELVRQYRDFPLGGVDASIVAVAERLDIATIFTLDHRHFRAIRPKHVDAFTLLP